MKYRTAVTDFDAYLDRLGVEAEHPTAEGLVALHRAQVERVPYETLWIHLGQAWDTEVDAAVARIARQGRGGYCYHLNGAFGRLLEHLGYAVTRHVGGVHGPEPADRDLSNHLVLTVAELPTAGNPEGDWYVDAGLGDALHEPLPLVAGRYAQGPFSYELVEPTDGIGDWRLLHDPKGSFTSMSWRSAPAAATAFAERHVELSTSPESGFVRTVSAQRRDRDGCDILRGLVLTRVGAGAEPAVRLLDERGEWFAELADGFGLVLADIGDARP